MKPANDNKHPSQIAEEAANIIANLFILACLVGLIFWWAY